MRNTYLKLSRFLLVVFVLVLGPTLRGQTTISTTGFTNNNGSSVVTFNFVNNNAFPVIITDVASIAGATGTNTAELWYKPGAISGPPGAISVANGWTVGATNPVNTTANTTTTTTQPMITGANLVIPASSTYAMAFSLVNGNLRYSTITAGSYTFTGGGCDIVTGTSIGYGGTLASPTNTPRGFLGSITFIPMVACSGTPNPGNTLSSANPVCPNANFTLSLQNSLGTGITYQWQSSPNNVSYTNIPSATNATYTTSITTATWYQCVVTCTNSGQTATSTPILVNVGFSAACYCQTIPTFTADEEIFNVTIGTLNNTSNCATVAPGPGSLAMQYANYTAGPSAPAAPNLTQGIPYNFSVNVNTCGTFNYNSGLAIFIDYNIDGDFNDPGEKVYSNGANANITCIPATTVTGSITIPVSSTPGTTVMRVIDAESNAGDIITGCFTYGYGETEDYLVNIVAAPPIDIAVTGFARPLTTGCYSNADSVVVTVSNQGSAVHDFSINPMTINASVTGPNAMSFTPVVVNTGTLAIAGSMNVVIATNYNMSAAGTYGFSATATTSGDANSGNNSTGPANFTFAAGTAVAIGSGRVCTGGPANVAITGLSPANASVQWQSSTNNSTWTNIIGQTSPICTEPALDTTFYRAVVCGVIMSVSDTVFTINVAPATATHDTICGFGTATLTAAGTGQLDWYDAQTGGTLVDTGLTINPFVNATDTFWVENTFRDCGTGTPVTPTCYPTYSNACTSNDYIESFSTTNGSTNISNLMTGCNGAFPTNTTFFPSQAVSTTPGGTFNFTVQAGAAFGQGFRMWIDYNNDGDFADAGEDVWDSGFSSTAAFTGSVTVPSNTAPGPKRMRLMCRYATVPVSTDYCSPSLSFGEVEEYTVNVCTLCGAVRVPSIVTITTAPAINATTSSTLYCSGDTIAINVASANGQYAYTWSPAVALNTTTGSSVMAMNPAPGSYTYYVNAQDPSGCQNSDSVTFAVNLSPSVIASANPTVVCGGDTSLINTTVNTVAYAVDVPNTQNTTTTYPAPYGNWYWGSHHQILILASEMTAAGITPGPITGLSWEVLQLNAATLQGFAIRMAHTNQTSLASFQAIAFQTVVPPTAYTPSSGVNVHTFNTPFIWNGVDNIIIETCFNNTSFTGNCVFAQVTMPYTATQYYFQDATGICAVPTANGSSNDRPATTLYAQSTTLGYVWSPSLGLNSATASDPVAMPPMSTIYSVIVTDPATGCTANDTVSINTLPTPVVNLGADTVICSNTSLVLDAGNGNYTYMWQDSSAAQTFSVNSFGNYSVTVVDVASGCDARDTILVGINAAPSFSLGSDATVCQGTQVSFAGPNGGYSYLWNTLDSVISITTGTAGSYNLEVTDLSNGCSSMDTVMLTVNPLPPVALGNDTSVCSANGALTLSAPSGYSYLWNTLDSSLSIAVNSTGNYSVMVTDPATSCFANDTIMVTFNASPVANLGNDTSFCSANGPINLVAPAGPYSYMWNTLDSSMFISAGSTGMYTVNVLDTLTGCTTADSINVTVNASPSFTLVDTSFCGTQYTLAGPTGPYAYNWSTLDSTSSILVSASGTYSLTVTDVASGCTGSDVSTINLNSNPSVTASGSDLTPCEDDANVILTGAPSGGAFTGPAVAGGQFDPSIGGGTYQVVYTYTDPNGCAGTDTLSIMVDECVGINEQFGGADMTIYPNPNAGQFTFFAADMNCEKLIIEIVSVEGQVIMSTQYSNVQGNFTQEIDLNDFANGVYIMRVVTDGTVYTNRVIKQD